MISVFIADDHGVVRDGLRSLVQAQHDMTVVAEAADGRTAVSEVDRHKPDIAVLDIGMPQQNGIEAAAQINESCPGTRVVILSMHAAAEHVVRALEAGAMGYVLKESAGREVVDAIRAVHKGQRYLSPPIAEALSEEYLRRVRAPGAQSALDLLSARERQILQLVVEGYSSARIAETLNLSPKTVETYRSRLMTKLSINDIPSLVKFAIRHGLTPLE